MWVSSVISLIRKDNCGKLSLCFQGEVCGLLILCSFLQRIRGGLRKIRKILKIVSLLREGGGNPPRQKWRRAIGHTHVLIPLCWLNRQQGPKKIRWSKRQLCKGNVISRVPLCPGPRGVHKKYLSSIQWIFQLWSSEVSQCLPAGIQESAKTKPG